MDGSPDRVIAWNTTFTGFQVILFSNGQIQLNYRNLDTLNGGIAATVGIWNGTADAIALPAGKFVPGPHSINGQFNDHNTHSDTNDSYVRMAWDTGGAAWDIGVAAAGNAAANELRNTFIASLSQQINDAADAGKVFRSDEVVLAFNVGDGAVAGTEFVADTLGGGTSIFVSSGQAIDTNTNALPISGDTSPYKQVFRSAKKAPDAQTSLNLSITPSAFPTLTNGRYVVELYFADIGLPAEALARVFNVVIEGKTMLRNYSIYNDRAKIVEVPGSPVVELDATLAGRFTAIVKRFEVEVSDAAGAGLQVGLQTGGGAQQPAILNGIRILKTTPPRIEDIVLKGTDWTHGVEYSYATAVAGGDQLRPMYRQGADRIEVHFDSTVALPADPHSALTILGTNRTPITQFIFFEGYNAASRIATWSLTSPLGKGKYALQLNGVMGSAGSELDGEWTNRAAPGNETPTFDDFTDDPGQTLLSGNGVAGGAFEFFFSVLPGDYNQDGMVRDDTFQLPAFSDLNVDEDGNGDGVHTAADDAIVTNIVAAAVDQELPFRAKSGDYYTDDDIVNGADSMVQEATLGQVVGQEADGYLEADGNLNGAVEADDQFLPIVFAGNYSAWHLGVGSAPPTQVGQAPRVMEVTISGSTSLHAPFGFDAQNRDGSGQQLVTVPVGGADTVSITFNENVNVQADHLTLVGLRTANRPELAEFAYDIASMTASWRFTDWWITGDHYVITLSEKVSDVEGDWLDGEWENPATLSTNTSKEFPSGDGTVGGSFNFVATILPGDANLDLVVDFADYGILDLYYSPDQLGRLFANADFNGDGIVDIADFALLGNHYLNENLEQIWILADLNGDWRVDSDDIDILCDNDNLQNPTRADGDLDGDGDVDLIDVQKAIAQLGLELTVS
jgi:hypothetical protein